MQQIKQAMLAVFQDLQYKNLHPNTKKDFELAINRFAELEVYVSMLAANFGQLVQEKNKQICPDFMWIGGLSGGRPLMREVNKYEKAYNSAHVGEHDKSYRR